MSGPDRYLTETGMIIFGRITLAPRSPRFFKTSVGAFLAGCIEVAWMSDIYEIVSEEKSTLVSEKL
jgi:hypothetical protein